MEIKLKSGDVVIVDDEDYPIISRFQWNIQKKDHLKYAVYRWKFKGADKWNKLQMHRIILGMIGSKLQVDHKNGNGLDNRKENLRRCTQRENVYNSKIPKNNTSGYKGVWSQNSKTHKWRAVIRYNKKHVSLGCYSKKEDAALAYNKAAKRLFGKFAKLNKVKSKALIKEE